MEILAGATLVRKNKQTVKADEALKNKEIIALYFSAHWCPPCKKFTPILQMAYEELLEDGKPFEIIFVSSDQSADALFAYMKECHGDWLAVPFGSELIGKLKDKFSVSGIPALIVLRKDGTIISEGARSDIERKGTAAYKDWENAKK